MAEVETMAMHDAEIDQQTRKLHEGELVTGVVAGVSDGIFEKWRQFGRQPERPSAIRQQGCFMKRN